MVVGSETMKRKKLGRIWKERVKPGSWVGWGLDVLHCVTHHHDFFGKDGDGGSFVGH